MSNGAATDGTSGRGLARLAERAHELWHELMKLPGFARSVRTLVVVAGGLKSEPITLRAAALTYLTALSLIPLLAVVFSIFQAVVGTDKLQASLQDYILRNLAVGAQQSFARYIDQYVQRASGAALGGIGFVVLLASAVSLLANVESAFNHTFRAPKERRLVVRFGVYWCVLTLGPILLSLSIAGTAMLGTSRAVKLFGPARGMLTLVLPFLITYGAFTLLYLIVPAVPVKRRAALLGAVVAGTAWEVAKIVYTWVSAHALRRDAIYGSLSAIPAFLLWAYLSWIILLFGARVAYAAQASHAELDEQTVDAPLGRELFALRAMEALGRAFAAGAPAPTLRELALALSASEGMVRAALLPLEKAGLAVQVTSARGEGGWAPARSLSAIRLADVRRAVRGRVGGGRVPLEPGLASLAARWAAADAAAEALLGTTLAELVEKPPEAVRRASEELSGPDGGVVAAG